MNDKEIELASIRAEAFMLLKMMNRFAVVHRLFHQLEDYLSHDAGLLVLTTAYFASNLSIEEFGEFVQAHHFSLKEFEFIRRYDQSLMKQSLEQMDDEQFLNSIFDLVSVSFAKPKLPNITVTYNRTVH